MAKIIHPGLPQDKLGHAAYMKAWRARTGNTSHKYEVKKRTAKIAEPETPVAYTIGADSLSALELRLQQIDATLRNQIHV